MYSIDTYFLAAPSPLAVVATFEAMTGLPMGGAAYEEPWLRLTHPAYPTSPVSLGWKTDRLQTHAQLETTLQGQWPLPFPTYPVALTLEAALLNTRAHSYLRNVALAVLQRLGGVRAEPFTLPAWANQP